MNPKLLLCLGLVLSGGLFKFPTIACGADESSAIKVMIDIPLLDASSRKFQPGHKPQWTRTLHNHGSNPHFFVAIQNTNSGPLFLSESSADGFLLGHLSFELTEDDGKSTVVRPRFPAASAVVNEIEKLEAGQTAVLEIDCVDGANGFPFPFPKDGNSRKVTIRARFEQGPFQTAATNSGLWEGKTLSEPYEVTLADN